MEAEAIRVEKAAQKAYVDFVKEANAYIEAKSKEIVKKSESKAKAEADLVEANGFEEYKKTTVSGGRSVKKNKRLSTQDFLQHRNFENVTIIYICYYVGSVWRVAYFFLLYHQKCFFLARLMVHG